MSVITLRQNFERRSYEALTEDELIQYTDKKVCGKCHIFLDRKGMCPRGQKGMQPCNWPGAFDEACSMFQGNRDYRYANEELFLRRLGKRRR